MIIDHPRRNQIPELQGLWQAVFPDPKDYIEGFFVHAFSPPRCLCIREDGSVAAMVHWLDMTCRGKKIAYIYAVATRKAYRGRGFCRALMDRAHEILAAQGYAGAALVPQGEELFAMYEKMGYRSCGGIHRIFCSAGEAVSLIPLTWQEWNARRCKMLPPGSAELTEVPAAYLGHMSQFWAGEDFLLAGFMEEGILHGIELLGNSRRAPGILSALGCEEGSFPTPGGEPFAMYRSLDGITPPPRYFGIAFD